MIQLRKMGATVALLVLHPICQAQPAAPYQGEWAYWQGCAWGHSAHLVLKQEGDGVTSTWNDGTRTESWEGKLKGTVRDDKLHAGQCYDNTDDKEVKICPQYAPESENTFVRQGTRLVWYRGSERYLVLHLFVKGKKVPVDPGHDCKDE